VNLNVNIFDFDCSFIHLEARRSKKVQRRCVQHLGDSSWFFLRRCQEPPTTFLSACAIMDANRPLINLASCQNARLPTFFNLASMSNTSRIRTANEGTRGFVLGNCFGRLWTGITSTPSFPSSFFEDAQFPIQKYHHTSTLQRSTFHLLYLLRRTCKTHRWRIPSRPYHDRHHPAPSPIPTTQHTTRMSRSETWNSAHENCSPKCGTISIHPA
jgi:hypothetical protein